MRQFLWPLVNRDHLLALQGLRWLKYSYSDLLWHYVNVGCLLTIENFDIGRYLKLHTTKDVFEALPNAISVTLWCIRFPSSLDLKVLLICVVILLRQPVAQSFSPMTTSLIKHPRQIWSGSFLAPWLHCIGCDLTMAKQCLVHRIFVFLTSGAGHPFSHGGWIHPSVYVARWSLEAWMGMGTLILWQSGESVESPYIK